MTTETKTTRIIVADISQPYEEPNYQRINISGAIDLDISERDWSQGVDLLGVYLMPRAKRVLLHTYDRWEDRRHPGRVHGDAWRVADNATIAALARRFDCDVLANLLPLYADA